MTAIEFRQIMTAQMALWGNAYAVKVRDLAGRIIGLIPLKADRMSTKILNDGSMVYLYGAGYGYGTETQLAYRTYFPADLLHIPAFGFDRRGGLPPMAFARITMGVAASAEDYMSEFMQQDGKQPGVLMIDRQLTSDQRDKLKQNFQGLTMKSDERLFVLEYATKFERISVPPIDAQMLQNREFQVSEICRFFGVPEFLVSHGSKTSNWGTGLEQMNRGFLQYSFQPYLERWEQRIWLDLLDANEKMDYFVDHDVEDFLSADSPTLAEVVTKLVQGGVMTQNEGRKRFGMAPRAGGDQLIVQVNMTPAAQLGRPSLEATT